MLGGKMFERPLQLSATDQLTGAVEICAFATDIRLADWAVFRHAKWGTALFTNDRYTFGNCGNHVTGAFDLDRVADPNILSLDFIGIVQCGSANSDAADLHRFQ